MPSPLFMGRSLFDKITALPWVCYKTRFLAGWVRSPSGFTLPIIRSTGGLQSAARAEIPFITCWIILTHLKRTLFSQFARQ